MTGLRIVRLDSIDSTSRELLDRARAGEPEGLVLVAEEQTAGRGRQGRSWLSPPGRGLTFSALRRPDVPARQASRWTWIAGLAAHAAVQRLLPSPGAWLKWPNDLLVGERKLCGLLCDLLCEGERVGAIVVGIGVNVRAPPDGWPPELADRAISLEEAGADPGSDARDALLADVLRELVARERDYLERGPGPLMESVREAMAPMFGRRVRAEIGGELRAVTVHDVRDSGALEVVDESGAVRQLMAGDVHLGAVGCFS